MSISFPFKFVELGEAPPFNIQANPDFPMETEPVCILTNLGAGGSAAPDTFITVGSEAFPNAADTWELTFHWATTGGPAAGTWQIDAWLQSISPLANVVVPGFPKFVGPGNAAVIPQRENQVYPVAPAAGFIPALAPGVFLFRLYATLRFAHDPFSPGSAVRVAGRAEGPLIEFYVPA
jgi:hypothetical protein